MGVPENGCLRSESERDPSFPAIPSGFSAPQEPTAASKLWQTPKTRLPRTGPNLAIEDRTAVREILVATLPDLPPYCLLARSRCPLNAKTR